MPAFSAPLLAILILTLLVFFAIFLAFLRRGATPRYSYKSAPATPLDDARSDVCLIVPCVPSHVAHLPALLRSAVAQTLPPRAVVVALSEASASSCAATQRSLRAAFPTLSIFLTCTPSPALSSANRNRGARFAASLPDPCSIFSFFDADDVMRPTRLEDVTRAMALHGADAALHSFGTRSETVETADAEGAAHRLWTPDELRAAHVAQKARKGPIHLQLRVPPHHGHITVTREAYEVETQDESTAFRRSEDSEYVRRLLDKGRKVVYLEKDLSHYRYHLSAAAARPRS